MKFIDYDLNGTECILVVERYMHKWYLEIILPENKMKYNANLAAEILQHIQNHTLGGV